MQNKIVGAIGVKGSGKSSLSKMLFSKASRAIAVDPMNEYETGVVIYSPLEVVKYLKTNDRFHVIFRPIEEEDYEVICRIARTKGNLSLHLEEIGNYCTPQGIKPELKKCHLLGRHAMLDIVYTTQRFSECHRSVTAMTDTFALFRMVEPVDIDSVRTRFGQEVSARVSKLDDLQYIKISARRKDESDYSVGHLGFSGRMVHCNDHAADTAKS